MSSDKLTLTLSGTNRAISTEVLLKHIATALRHVELTNGTHEIEVHRDGAISVNGIVAYVPARPQIANRGAA